MVKQLKASDWCRKQYDLCVTAGDMASASDYIELYELWLEREKGA